MTVSMPPVSVLDDAVAKARAAARDLLPLISATLHHQFPTGAYLVLARPTADDDDDLELHSVRDAHGRVLRDFTEWRRGLEPLPTVPESITALWGALDPCEPRAVQELIQRIDEVRPYAFFEFLPDEVRTDDEIDAEEEGGRVPLGVPLTAPEPKRCAVCVTPVDEHAGRICERPATAYC
ncbi:hypothetical protein [Streptomyces anulatus]|uniref:hypothetical protein n=1 Tax=Streptomyces anulatus TaxID=1892 RepID=UPI003666153E